MKNRTDYVPPRLNAVEETFEKDILDTSPQAGGIEDVGYEDWTNLITGDRL